MDAHSHETDRTPRAALALPVRAALATLCGAACAALLAHDPLAFVLYPPAAGLMAALLCEGGRRVSIVAALPRPRPGACPARSAWRRWRARCCCR